MKLLVSGPQFTFRGGVVRIRNPGDAFGLKVPQVLIAATKSNSFTTLTQVLHQTSIVRAYQCEGRATLWDVHALFAAFVLSVPAESNLEGVPLCVIETKPPEIQKELSSLVRVYLVTSSYDEGDLGGNG